MSKYRERTEGFEAGDAGQRPDVCTDEHLAWLTTLRDSGLVNMFGARPHLQGEFPELTDGQSAAVLGYWMRTCKD
jgi:hypothetical protein